MSQCNKTFYHDNLLHFHGKNYSNIVLKHNNSVTMDWQKITAVKSFITLARCLVTKGHGTTLTGVLSFLSNFPPLLLK